MRKKRSFQIALGGVICGLGLVSLMLTGVIPFATFTLPCLAGLLLVAVVIECGSTTAWICYGATAILALLITPDREAALMYVAFFGYYPMIKQKLEQRLSRPVEWGCKLAIFNVAVVSAYLVAIYLFGMTYLLEDMGEWGKYTLLATLGLGNLVFVVYDIAMTRLITLYLLVIRKKLFKRF